MFRTVAAIALASLMLFLPRAHMAAPVAPADTVTYFIASDLHYLSPRLYTPGTAFDAVCRVRDGKEVRYGEQLLDAFIDTVRQAKPDALILTGDLTLNGELFSHEDLAKKLSALDPSVTKVYVIPGNHDLNNPNATAYVGDHLEPAEYCTPTQFADIYADCGLTKADYQRSGTLDYVVRAEKGPWLMMIDSTLHATNLADGSPNAAGHMSYAAVQWTERFAQRAREAGREMITFTHHNLFVHNMALRSGYAMANNREVAEMMHRAGIRLNMSGHMHAQDIAEVDGLVDIAGGAMTVYPHSYGVLTIQGTKMDYRAERVDVAAWAKAQGLTDPNLLDYPAYDRAHFDATANSGISGRAESLTCDAALKEKVRLLGMELNARYYAGEDPPPVEDMDADALFTLLNSPDELGEYIVYVARPDGVDDLHRHFD